MRKLFLTFSLAMIGSLLAITAHADPMVVFKERAVFLATNNSLTILPDSPSEALTCSYDPANDAFLPGSAASIQVPVPGAMDIKVIGKHAYIATSTPVNDVPTTGYVKYDVSACVPAGPFTPPVAQADLASGELVIPCVLVDGNEYNVIMNRRGNSMNWEVIFAESGCN